MRIFPFIDNSLPGNGGTPSASTCGLARFWRTRALGVYHSFYACGLQIKGELALPRRLGTLGTRRVNTPVEIGQQWRLTARYAVER
jgi:hypothetical protein